MADDTVIGTSLSVATHGLLDPSCTIAVALMGEFICEEPLSPIDAALPPGWYTRIEQGSPLVGPLSFNQAVTQARYESRVKDGPGKCEVVTIRGARKGDPAKAPNALFVVYIYILGKRSMGGRVADYHSKNDLLPDEVPDYGYEVDRPER